MSTLVWFRSGGPLTRTRFPYLHVWHQGPGLWRIVATDDEGDSDVTGPPYRTKIEALSALDQTARDWAGE